MSPKQARLMRQAAAVMPEKLRKYFYGCKAEWDTLSHKERGQLTALWRKLSGRIYPGSWRVAARKAADEARKVRKNVKR